MEHIFDPLNPVLIEIGKVKIHWYAVLILSGALLAMVLGMIEAKKIGVPPSFIEDLAIFGIPISIVGARIYYVIFAFDQYKDNFWKVFNITEGGLAIHGAVITALIWGYYFCKRSNVNFLKAIDLAAPGFLIAQAIGRWGNFMNQEAHGPLVPGENWDMQREFLEKLMLPEFIINQMYLYDGGVLGYYHPTFLYESLWNIVGFGIMLVLRRTKKLFIGDLGLIYLMWYGIGRFFIEKMRTDALMLLGFKVNEVLSLLMFIGGLAFLIYRHYKKIYPKRYHDLLEENKQETV